MASLDLVRRLNVRLPSRSYWERMRESILKASKPSLSGIDVQDLDQVNAGLPIAIIYISGLVVCFISLVYSITTIQINQTFLAKDANNSNAICKEVPLSITNTFQGSLSGVWDTAPGFKLNESLFILEMHDTKLTNDEYSRVMKGFQQKLGVLGSKLAKRPLIYTAIAYSTYYFVDRGSGMQFYSSSDAGDLFDRQVEYAFFTNKDGVCIGGAAGNDSFIWGDFNFASKSLRVNLPVPINSVYMNNLYQSKTFYDSLNQRISCAKQLLPVLGLESETWKVNYRDGVLPFEFDARSIALAVSFNLGITSTLGYDEINDLRRFGLIGFTDTSFETPITPVWCIDKLFPAWNLTKAQMDGPQVCYIQTKLDLSTHSLHYPSVTSLYRDESQCSPVGICRNFLHTCPCKKHCQQRDRVFDLALIYTNKFLPPTTVSVYDDDYAYRSIQATGVDPNMINLGLKMQAFLLNDPENGDVTMSEYLLPIFGYSLNAARAPALADDPLHSWDAGADYSRNYMAGFQNQSYANGKSQNQLLKEAWEEVCADCAAIIIESWQYESTVPRINPHDLTFQDLAGNSSSSPECSNLISQSEAINKLVASPPVKLVNSYYDFNKTPSAALTSALGSALASSNAIMTTAWVVGGWLFVFIANRFFHEAKISKLPSQRAKKELHDAFEETKNETLMLLMAEIVTALEQCPPTSTEGKEQRLKLQKQYEMFRRLYALLLPDSGEQTAPTDKAELDHGALQISREIAAKVERQRSQQPSSQTIRKREVGSESDNPMQTRSPEASVLELEMTQLPLSPRQSVASAVLKSSAASQNWASRQSTKRLSSTSSTSDTIPPAETA